MEWSKKNTIIDGDRMYEVKKWCGQYWIKVYKESSNGHCWYKAKTLAPCNSLEEAKAKVERIIKGLQLQQTTKQVDTSNEWYHK